MTKVKKLILASASPRRAELLKQIGLDFEIIAGNVDETPPPGLSPPELVEFLAGKKAGAVAGKLDDGIIIAADTVVVWQGQIMGKPQGNDDAFAILKKLQGSHHEVYTGVAINRARSGEVLVGHEHTRVFFRAIGEEEIRRYVAGGEPLDKAGAYGAQGLGAIFMERLEGCYTNVVGLPLARLSQMLGEFGVYVL